MKASSLRSTRWRYAELVFWLLPVLAYFLLPNYLALGSQILIMALFALSLDIVVGFTGIVSVGHALFFGIGAYVAGAVSVMGWGEPLTGLLIAALASAVVGFLSSLLIVRGNQLARMMITLGLSALVYEAAGRAKGITGGSDGMQGIDIWNLLGLFHFDMQGKTAYVYCLVVVFVLFVLVRRVVRSPYGLALTGIRENTPRMRALGVRVDRLQIVGVTFAAALAGVAGALQAQTTQFVGVDSLGLQRSADGLIMLVLGGVGRLYGGLIGAAVYMIGHEFLSSLNPVYWTFWMGLLLVALTIFIRGGILGLLDRLQRWLKRARS
ncbi:MAG: branched-chain amino acid ABC transporter permease [Janthinobacterium lividum]